MESTNFISYTRYRIFVVLPFVLFTALPLIAIIYSVKVLPEWLKWQRWSKSSQKSLTRHEFYTLINTFRYRSYHLRVIKHVRKCYLLIATKETEASLKKLALELEIYLRSKKRIASECPILVGLANYEILDEIYLLLEDIRSSLHEGTISA